MELVEPPLVVGEELQPLHLHPGGGPLRLALIEALPPLASAQVKSALRRRVPGGTGNQEAERSPARRALARGERLRIGITAAEKRDPLALYAGFQQRVADGKKR